MSKHGNSDTTTTFPFGTYDIFGYIIPGATVLLSIINFEHWYDFLLPGKAMTPVVSTMLGPIRALPANNAVYAVVYMGAMLAVVYVSGHIVSSVSSLFLDKIYVAKAQGYPFETLLGLPRTKGLRREDSKGFYQGMFFWLNLYMVFRFLSFIFNLNWLRQSLHGIEIVVVATCLLKLGVSLLRQVPASGVYRWLNQPGPRLWLVRPVKLYLARIFPAPLQALTKAIASHTRTGGAFDEQFKDCYKRHFSARFNVDAELAGSDNFWNCKMFVARTEPIFDRNLTYWLDMYTYSRNLATAFYIAFLYCFGFVYYQYPVHSLTNQRSLFILLTIPLGYFVLAGVLAARYRYIFVGYFNRFLYRSFVFLCGTARPAAPEQLGAPGGNGSRLPLETLEPLASVLMAKGAEVHDLRPEL